MEHVQLTEHLLESLSLRNLRRNAIELEQQNIIRMANAAAKKLHVASSEWIQTERALAGQWLGEAADDFGYSVRNELEWLDEHMKEVFSKDQVYVIHALPSCSVCQC